MRKTKLDWPDYKKAALKLKSQGLGYPKIYERLGAPVFNGVEYKLESDKGNIKRKTREASRAGKTSSTKTRLNNQTISTPNGTDTKATNRLVKEINGAGNHADHEAELSRTGNGMRDMSPKRRELYLKRMGGKVGHQASNIQSLSAKDNGQKNIDYRNLDSHIRKLAKTPVVGKPDFRGLKINGGSKFRAIHPIFQYLPEINDALGKPVDRALLPIVNGARKMLGAETLPPVNGEINPTVAQGLELLKKFHSNGRKAVEANGISTI